MEISYGQGPCDDYYIPPGEDGQCPEGHRFIDERTGCVPESISLYYTPSPPSPPTPCPLDAQGNEVCPPTDEPTPIPGPPTPQCPEAGPEVCDEEPTPPPDEDRDSNGDAAGDGDSNGNGNGNGNGEDGSNGDGNNGGDSNGGNGGTFDGGGSFFD